MKVVAFDGMNTHSQRPLLARLDAHDRAIMARFVLGGASGTRVRCRMWLALTHLGSASFAIVITIALLLFPTPQRELFGRAAVSLLASHLIVRLIKRRAVRARPAVTMSLTTLVATPDQFSFPSGHASAAMSVAISYAVCFPTIAPLFLLLAFVVGTSRIALGVHYPGDVVVGQLISVMVAIISFA